MMKKIAIVFSLLFILCSSCLMVEASESSYSVNSDENLEYSQLYLEYLSKSEEEKENIEVIPRMYDVPLDYIYKDTKVEKEEPSVFNLFGLLAKSSRVSVNQNAIPEEFDLRTKINIPIKNQSLLGLCWAFSSITSLETNLALNGYGEFNFSEMHLDYLESEEFGKDRTLHQGGRFSNFEDYVSNNYGPVLEEEVPYKVWSNYTIDDYDYFLSLESKVYVRETVNFPTIDKLHKTYTDEELNLFRSKVKEHIMNCGSVWAYIDAEKVSTQKTEYLYDVDSNINSPHAVSIIGWDDNFSKDFFDDGNGNKPSKDGAYIVANSWGEEFGNDGIFYISYEDALVESQMSGVVEARKKDDYSEEDVLKIQDKNLYETLKERLKEKIFMYDDAKQELYITKLSIENIEELDFSNRNIENLNGLEKFTNLKKLNLSQNNISNISVLEKIDTLNVLDLSNNNITTLECFDNKFDNLKSLNLGYNKITDVSILAGLDKLAKLDLSGNLNIQGIDKLTNISTLDLNNCELNDDILDTISQINLSSISLRNNDLVDVWKLSGIPSVDLSGNRNLDLNEIPLSTINNLVLEECNLTDISFLQDFNGNYLSLRNNLISDVSCLEDMSRLLEADLSYTNVKDVSKLAHIGVLKLSGNVGLLGLENLEDVWNLEIQNCGITDASFLSNLENLEVLDISYNNIQDIEWLEQTNIIELNINNNGIFDLNTLDREFDELCVEEQTRVLDVDIEINQNIEIDLPELFEYAYKNRYKMNCNVIVENCVIDYESGNIIINSKELGQNTAIIEINGGSYDRSKYTINYNVVNNVATKGIQIVKESNKKDYIENENFDNEGMVVKLLYENDTMREIYDYSILNGNSLQLGQQEVTIKYGEYETTQEITVYEEDKIIKIQFNTQNVYDSVYKRLKENVIFKEDNTRTIAMLKEDVAKVDYLSLILDDQTEDLTGISEFYNIDTLSITYGGNINLEEINKLKNLKTLTITMNDRLKSLSNMECTIEELFLVESKVSDIGNILERSENVVVYVDNYFEDNELETDSNRIYLPQYINEIAKKENDISYKTYSVKGENNLKENTALNKTSITKEGDKYYLTLDNEIAEDKPEGRRAVEIITGEEDVTNYGRCVIYYTASKEVEKELDSIEIVSMPTRVEYIEGEKFDSTGLKLNKVYTDGSKEQLDEYKILPERELTTEDKNVTIEYEENNITKTVTININVKEKEIIKGIDYSVIDGKKYITILDTDTNMVKDVLNYNNFPYNTCSLQAINKDGQLLKNEDRLGTGSKVEILDEENQTVDEYYIAIRGEIDGNGTIDLYDILKLIELVFDNDDTYEWKTEMKLAGECDGDKTESINPNLYDILRLIDYYFDDVKW